MSDNLPPFGPPDSERQRRAFLARVEVALRERGAADLLAAYRPVRMPAWYPGPLYGELVITHPDVPGEARVAAVSVTQHFVSTRPGGNPGDATTDLEPVLEGMRRRRAAGSQQHLLAERQTASRIPRVVPQHLPGGQVSQVVAQRGQLLTGRFHPVPLAVTAVLLRVGPVAAGELELLQHPGQPAGKQVGIAYQGAGAPQGLDQPALDRRGVLLRDLPSLGEALESRPHRQPEGVRAVGVEVGDDAGRAPGRRQPAGRPKPLDLLPIDRAQRLAARAGEHAQGGEARFVARDRLGATQRRVPPGHDVRGDLVGIA